MRDATEEKLQPPAHVLPTPVKTSLEPKIAANLCAEASLPNNKDVAPSVHVSQPSQPFDQPKRGPGRPRKDPYASVQASKSNIPQAALEVPGNEEVHICPICLEGILEATSDRERQNLYFAKV